MEMIPGYHASFLVHLLDLFSKLDHFLIENILSLCPEMVQLLNKSDQLYSKKGFMRLIPGVDIRPVFQYIYLISFVSQTVLLLKTFYPISLKWYNFQTRVRNCTQGFMKLILGVNIMQLSFLSQTVLLLKFFYPAALKWSSF